MDMRLEFNKLLQQYGHYVLLVHNNRRLRCSCWNDKTQEALKTCPYCFGLGHIPVVTRHLCRERIVTVADSMGRILQPYQYGETTIPSRGYYFKHDVEIAVKDFIVDVPFDARNIPILSDYRIYEINYAEGFRGEKGRTEYIKVYASADTVNMEIVAANIRKSGNTDIYNLGMRRSG